MIFFLMAICHQPYSEIIGEREIYESITEEPIKDSLLPKITKTVTTKYKQGIPIEDCKDMMEVFTKTLESIFGKGKKGKENLKRIAMNMDIKAFEDMWKPKEEPK